MRQPDRLAKCPARSTNGVPMTDREIALILWPQFQMLDVIGPLEAFTMANRFAGPHYRTVLLSARGTEAVSSSGYSLGPAQHLYDCDPNRFDTVIVPGGLGVHAMRDDDALMDWLRRGSREVRRLCSVCSGAFLLAEAGLLSGRRAVTHWESVPRLTSEFPSVQVEPDALYCQDGNIWTAAGVTSGMDMALALIEQDLGRSVALATARELVLYLKRPGGQSQFSSELLAQERGGSAFDTLMGWLFNHLDRPIDVETMADRAAMSRRSFQRRFTETFGMPPAKFVERARVDAARRDLEDGARGLERVAAARGFGDAERMRRSFQRVLGLSPAEYRDRFRTASRTA